MRVLVRISPFLLLPDRFRVKPYPSKQKKGGWIFAPKGKLVRGLVCWAKMVHFWKPWNHAFWPSPECREPFSMLPRHALSSSMVWNGRGGQQPKFKSLWSALPSTGCFDKQSQMNYSTKLSQSDLQGGLFSSFLSNPGCRQIFEWLNIVYILTCSIVYILTCSIVYILTRSIVYILTSCWHQGGALGNPIYLAGISTLPTWAPPATNWVCKVAQLGPAWGPAYSELGGSFGARTLTGMADLTNTH